MNVNLNERVYKIPWSIRKKDKIDLLDQKHLLPKLSTEPLKIVKNHFSVPKSNHFFSSEGIKRYEKKKSSNLYLSLNAQAEIQILN